MPSTDDRAKRGSDSERVVAGTGLSLSSFAAANDAKKLQMLQDVMQRTQVDANQNTDLVQKFLNAIGWADHKPTLVADEDALKDAFEGGQRQGATPYLYHTDAPVSTVPDARVFADQYQGQGRQYASNGVAGGGTYFAPDPFDSIDYGYGARSSYQQKGFLNKKAAIINKQGSSWGRLQSDFARKYPKTWRYMRNNSYSNNEDTIIAAMHGYNVIKNWDYYTVLDRSATTVAKKGHHGASFGNIGGGRGTDRNPWKHN